MIARGGSRSIGFAAILIIAMILLTGVGTPFPALEVAIKNNRDESIIIYAKPFDYLITTDSLKIPGSYVFEYYGLDTGGVELGTYDDYPRELPAKLTFPCYDYPSAPWSYAEGVEWWPNKPVEEHFKLVYEEFTVYDTKGNEILSLETLTNANFIKKLKHGNLYNWYLVIE
jgi:hypothetical protein